MTDVGRALRPGIPFLLALFALAGAAGTPAFGWQPLLPVMVAVLVYAVMWIRNVTRRGSQEAGTRLRL